MLTDLALLKSLASRITHCTYFEIGTWRGESVSIVAPVAQQCVTLNLSSEDMKQRGWPDEYADQHGFFSKNLSNVSHVFGDSKSFDFAQLNTKFDLIFIDGDHHHDYVTNDTNCVFHHLVHKDSVVVWHDYAHSPEQLRPEVLHGILSALPTHCHHQLYHVSNTLCAVLLPIDPIGLDIVPISATKKLKTPQGDWQVRIGK